MLIVASCTGAWIETIPAPKNHPCNEVCRYQDLKEPDKPKTILFNFSGHGLMEMAACDSYVAGKLHDYSYLQKQTGKLADYAVPCVVAEVNMHRKFEIGVNPS